MRKRYQILNDPSLSDYADQIRGWEASGNAQPIHSSEYRRQYTAKWGTDNALWYGMGELEIGVVSFLDAGNYAIKAMGSLARIINPATRTYKAIGGIAQSGIKVNPWNEFLKANKGKYSGPNWLQEAVEDYNKMK